jgi:hypothetical protein
VFDTHLWFQAVGLVPRSWHRRAGAASAMASAQAAAVTEAAKLREKYAPLSHERDGSNKFHHVHVSNGSPPLSSDALACILAAGDTASVVLGDAGRQAGRLDGVRICHECNGSGTMRELYNHMIMERTCRGCDGDGVIDRAAAVPDEPVAGREKGVAETNGSPAAAAPPRKPALTP